MTASVSGWLECGGRRRIGPSRQPSDRGELRLQPIGLPLVNATRSEQRDRRLGKHLQALPVNPQPLEEGEPNEHPQLVSVRHPCHRAASGKVRGCLRAYRDELSLIGGRDAADAPDIESALREAPLGAS